MKESGHCMQWLHCFREDIETLSMMNVHYIFDFD